MSKRTKEKAELIANGIMISVQGKTGRVVYNTKEKSFTHYELMCAAQKGYEQAEKDIALTWEDVNLIDSILVDLQDEGVERYGGLRQYYEEALKRFKEIRNEKEI